MFAASVPAGLSASPFALAVLAARGTPQAWGALAGLWAEAALITALSLALLQQLLSHGVVGDGVRESGRRAPLPVEVERDGRLARWSDRLPPMWRRDLRLLSRDRNFLIQTLLLPVILVGGQVLLNGGMPALRVLSSNGPALAGVAFGAAAYALMLSAFQVLNNEGGGLWLLYTFPQPLEKMLLQKARLWGVVTLIYPTVIIGAGAIFLDLADWPFAAAAGKAFLGLPVFAMIAVSLGIFACDPLGETPSSRLRPTFLYLYFLLAGAYGWAVVSSEHLQSLITIGLLALFAMAIWQKARDELPFLLDPTMSPPPTITLADGLVATLLFFSLQSLANLFMRGVAVDGEIDETAVLASYTLSGAATFVLVRYSYWRLRTQGVPKFLERFALKNLAFGVMAGAATGGLGCAYLIVDRAWNGAPPDSFPLHSIGLIAVLAIGVAPFCEEFIFRGLVFRGILRTQSLAIATLGSAGLFAIVHPPRAMIPVFVLGIANALVYRRTGSLLAAVFSHAAYNAVVLFAPALMGGG